MKLYNTYKNKYNQNIPKSAIIENTPEVREYLKNTYSTQYENGTIHENDDWLVIGINASYVGNLYMHIYTDNNITIYGTSYVKEFIDFESFKNYLNWAYNLPRYIVNKV